MWPLTKKWGHEYPIMIPYNNISKGVGSYNTFLSSTNPINYDKFCIPIVYIKKDIPFEGW